jgi:hypothetical protein
MPTAFSTLDSIATATEVLGVKPSGAGAGQWARVQVGAIPATLKLTGDISPAQITANQNNYNPTDLSTSAILRLSTDASRTLTGLAGGSDGRVVVIHNVGSFDLVLAHESGSSTAANRFVLPGAASLTLAANTAAVLQYDATSSRWRVAGMSASGAATVADDSVTNAKLADMAQATFKMRAAGAGTGDPIDGTAAQAKTALAIAQADVTGLTTADSPQFAALNIGAATDTTLTRTGAGDIAIEGNAVYRAGGTDVPVADGGTGASTASAAATNLGLGTGDTVQFNALNLGHASDTTLTRVSAGDIQIEANIVYRAGGTDVPITDGGTGASDASTARSNLGLSIGGDVQAFNAILADLAGLTQAANKLPYFDSGTTAATADLTAYGRSLVATADEAALKALINAEAGVDFQAFDADLSAIAALAPSNDDIVQRKAGAWTNRTIAQLLTDLAAPGTTFQPLDSDLTAIAALATQTFGRSLLTAAAFGAARTILGIEVVRKGSNETVNNSAALQNDDALLFSIAASETWIGVVIPFFTNASGTSDFKAALTWPSGASGVYGGFGRSTTGVTIEQGGLTTTSGTAIPMGGPAAAAGTFGLIPFSVTCGATPGNVTLQWAQNTATAEDTIVLAGSFILAIRTA